MSSSWGFQQRLIQAQFGNWSIQLDPSRPDQGMLVCSDLFEPLAVWALTPQPPHSLVPEEVYIRQSDLIARFQQTDSDQFSFQVDWRLLPVSAPFLAGVELWISLQTALLDTAPRFMVQSQGLWPWIGWTVEQLGGDVDPADVSQRAATAAVAWTGERASMLWLIDPHDLKQARWLSQPGECQQRVELFGDFLEKGVIRRARMQLLVADQAIDRQQAGAAYRQLSSRELPLTA